MRHYSIAGLNVASELALPGVSEGPEERPDVEIRCEPIVDRLSMPIVAGPNWQIDAANFLLRLPGIGRMMAREGRHLAIAPDEGVDPQDLLVFALGTGVGALLYQRGVTVLHASAVACNGQAYAFCGPSGVGKSTLAAALCTAGCRLVSDDVGAIRLDGDGRPLLWPDARQLKLFEPGLAAAGLCSRRQGPVRREIEKYYVEPPDAAVAAAMPLRAIYILSTDNRIDSPKLERLSGLNAAMALQVNGYRPRLALAMARAGNPVAVTAAILRHVAVFRLIRSSSLKRLPQLTEAIQQHWQTLGDGGGDAVAA